MPLFKANDKLVFYAHVPKCGGSAVRWYLGARFGPIAFHDDRITRIPPAGRWSRTSPQHIDRTSLARLFPPGFFDAVFTIVRHPLARLVSVYHFQREVECSVPAAVTFSEWLEDLPERRAEDPFLYDNHARPMSEIVPDGAQVFHMEHGLDGLVTWLDDLTGSAAGPRAVPRFNEKGRFTGDSVKVVPTAADIARVADLYAADFRRFGYRPDRPEPMAPARPLSPERIAERDAFLRTFNAPINRLRRKIGNALSR